MRETPETAKDTCARIGRAVLEGWEFSYFTFSGSETGRHSVGIQKPGECGFRAYKVDGSIDIGWVSALLDEAGVPK